MNVLITNIQRYAIHDGGGIRTTVFFKGCPLACSWCHNPETKSFEAEAGALTYPPRKLAEIVMRDQIFFGDSGGVTLSGGEPLAQDMAYMTEFLKILKQNEIHVACDTCGDAPWENFAAVLPYVDLFLYDIKAASQEVHIKHTKRGNERIITNLEKLHPLANVWLRIPVIGGVNDGEEMTAIINRAKSAAPGCNVSLLPYHAMGGRDSERGKFHTPSHERMTEIRTAWKNAGFKES